MGRNKNRERNDDSPLNPKLGSGLIAILLFVTAALSALSFFDMAGVAGYFIKEPLEQLFGKIHYLFPVILIIVAVLNIKDLEYDYRSTHIIGAILFFFSLNGLIHLHFPVADMYYKATQGLGGGWIGLAVAWPGVTYLGPWGTLVILIGLFIASLIFLFNTSLATIVMMHKKFFAGLGWIGTQCVTFFGSFKKEPVKVQFGIKGEYSELAAEKEAEIEEEEDAETDENKPARVFKHKTIASDEAEAAEMVDKPISTMPVAKPPKVWSKKMPSLEMLVTTKSKPSAGDIKGSAEVIRNTLHNFGIEVDMGEVRVGPTVTQYSLKPAAGIKLTRITTLSNNIALALAAHPIRIEAPIPGQSLVGIEVPNHKASIVTLRDLLEAPEFKNREHNMMIALGKDVAGKTWMGDLPKMPHLLVAGTTGSGKTVCINTIILSLLYQNTPETLRFIMVDPKRVELTLYNGIPHLLTPVITDAVKTINALKWALGEMDRRFDTLANAGKRDIGSYNKIAPEKLPYIVIVIDELADLMASTAAEVESGIIRLAQMARAVGIHLIIATQRPSVEVITGLMKANIPARIAFSVASVIDSRTILDTPGAEKLLGRGDMLLLTSDLSKPRRLQGAYVSEEEMKSVVDYLRGDEPPEYDDSIVSKNGGSGGTMNLFGGGSDDQDSMFDEAKACVLESGKASASLLQRRLKVGYARAARLLDEMEEAGIVGPADGAKPREVFADHLVRSIPVPDHKMPTPEPELEIEEQTTNSGGVVLNEDTAETETESENEETIPDTEKKEEN